jgi:hypothetical protein
MGNVIFNQSQRAIDVIAIILSPSLSTDFVENVRDKILVFKTIEVTRAVGPSTTCMDFPTASLVYVITLEPFTGPAGGRGSLGG